MGDIIKCWMPVTKSASGKFVGILSDTSLDRDEEFMSKELLESWSMNKSLKALANHDNKMQSWVGGWTDLKVIKRNGHTALVATPWFFSKEANPLASQIQKQVEEALDRGENAGISIGAIPRKKTEKEVDGQYHQVYEEAELLEATWVPLQSNRNASFGHIAKQFDLNMEEMKMADELPPEPVPEPEVKDEVKADVVEPEVKEDVVPEEPAVDPQAEVDAAKEVDAELEKAQNENLELKKELEELKSKAIIKGTVEAPVTKEELVKEVDNTPFSVEKGLNKIYG